MGINLRIEWMAQGPLHSRRNHGSGGNLPTNVRDICFRLFRLLPAAQLFQLFSANTLESVNSNFTLAVCSRKFEQAKTHFLCHLGEKKSKNMAGPGFEPRISKSDVERANHYTIGPLMERWQLCL